MAIITAEFDTKEKTLTVKRDGAAVANVRGVSFYCTDGVSSYDDGEDPGAGDGDQSFYCRIESGVRDKANDLMVYQTLVAAESPQGRELARAGAEPVKNMPEFVLFDSRSRVALDVADFFSKG